MTDPYRGIPTIYPRKYSGKTRVANLDACEHLKRRIRNFAQLRVHNVHHWFVTDQNGESINVHPAIFGIAEHEGHGMWRFADPFDLLCAIERFCNDVDAPTTHPAAQPIDDDDDDLFEDF